MDAGGNITIQQHEFYSGLYSFSYSKSGNSGNGGAIDLDADGNITVQELYSFSYSSSGNSGKGGDITLNAKTIKFNPVQHGNAEKLRINTFSVGKKESEEGKGGDVNITTNNLSNTEILTLSSHSKSGKVTIESKTQEPLQIKDSSIITSEQVTIILPWGEKIQLETGDTQSGDVSINSSGDLNLKNVTIESKTKSNQNAGNVNIKSPGQISLNSTEIISTTEAKGNAGNITITTPQNIELTNNSTLQADTQGSGEAGTITVQSQTLNLNEETSLTTQTSGAGAPGKIEIKADTIDIGKDAKISATITQDSTNTEGGGSINIDTNTLNISGTLGIFAETEGLADAGSLTLEPYNKGPKLDIKFSNNGFISASTKSTGNGGNISITAPENINIAGQGEIRVTTNNTGNAGTIKIETQNLKTSDQVSITASTTGDGNAGAINIITKTFNLTTGTSLKTETNSAGKAGDISINSEIVTIGEGAEISATANENATNTEAGGGKININANELNISGQL
ncbi:MAG: filamentous hemagglutinin, partial [Trichodesmium sp. St18_bin1]|nr:filamentous hemagglutinin [Trichodesmium sp. St18_bin1]